MSKKVINGITWVVRDGVWYTLYDIENISIPNFPSNKPTPSTAEENKLWADTSKIFLALKDPNLNKTI